MPNDNYQEALADFAQALKNNASDDEFVAILHRQLVASETMIQAAQPYFGNFKNKGGLLSFDDFFHHAINLMTGIDDFNNLLGLQVLYAQNKYEFIVFETFFSTTAIESDIAYIRLKVNRYWKKDTTEGQLRIKKIRSIMTKRNRKLLQLKKLCT